MGYSYFSIRNYADSLSSRFTMRAFLKDGTPQAQISQTAKAIRDLPGVAEVNWIPKSKAWEAEKTKNPDVTAGIENPFPDALKIKLKDVSKTSDVVAAIQSMPEISPTEGVQYLAGEQQLLSESMRFIRWIAFALGGLCLFTAGILIYNAIRLTVVARRRELRVMQLVGASFATIRIPFLIEGGVQGLLGGVVAALLMISAHFGLSRILLGYASLGTPNAFPFWPAAGLLAAAGITFGVLCALAAVRDPLKLGASGS
jgi:cell division transport system permease protein